MKKKRFNILIAGILIPLLGNILTACVQSSGTPGGTPSVTNLPPLPTASVPEMAIIDDAVRRWERSGNENYYMEVEERSTQDYFLVRVVVIAGEPRAAQILTRTPEGWSEPQMYPLEEARRYTGDALLERIRDEALGLGPAPLSLRIVFNQSTGLPEVVNAEAMASYTEAGTVQLNREHSYTLVSRIKALVEDTATPGKQPIVKFTRSNGPDAWCDNLEIYADGSSLYSDDCRQISMILTVPQTQMARVNALIPNFDQVDETRQDGESIQQLTITGEGQVAPDAQTVQVAWELTTQLHELLSYPLGAGVTLLFSQRNELLGMDMQRQTVQPAQLSIRGTFRGAAVNPDNEFLAYGDDNGLRVLNLKTGEVTSLMAAPSAGSYHIPRSWSRENRLLVSTVPSNADEAHRYGWIDMQNRALNDLPLPEGMLDYGCVDGAAWSPDGRYIALSGQNNGEVCGTFMGLVLVDLQTGQATHLIAPLLGDGTPAGVRSPQWSPNQEWIAISLDEEHVSGSVHSQLYLVRPDGRGLAPVSNNARGYAETPFWTPAGILYYALNNAAATENGIYKYDLANGVSQLIIAGEDLLLAGLSPDGNFLAYYRQDVLTIYAPLTGEDMPETIPPFQDEIPVVLGWLVPPRP